jgi:hypothetical protein
MNIHKEVYFWGELKKTVSKSTCYFQHFPPKATAPKPWDRLESISVRYVHTKFCTDILFWFSFVHCKLNMLPKCPNELLRRYAESFDSFDETRWTKFLS